MKPKTTNQRAAAMRAVIIAGRPTNRRTDSLLEEGDGAAVYALVRESALKYSPEEYRAAEQAVMGRSLPGDSPEWRAYRKAERDRKLAENFDRYLRPRLSEPYPETVSP